MICRLNVNKTSVKGIKLRVKKKRKVKRKKESKKISQHNTVQHLAVIDMVYVSTAIDSYHPDSCSFKL